MRKSFIALLLIASCISVKAAEIRFVKNKTWKQVLQLAKEQNRMIFFDAYASWCGPCKYMENSVYTSDAVAAYYNNSFINVKMDMEVGEGVKLSDEFDIGAYPTFLFISPSGKVLHKSVGAMEADKFLQLGKDAKNPATQYYTLREKVRNRTITDEGFAKWAAIAKRLKDEDLSALAADFLARKKDILLNEHVANVALKYADSLTDAQVFYIVQHVQRLQEVFRVNEDEAAEMIYDKLFSIATKVYNASHSAENFEKVFRKFDAKSASLAVKDLKIRIALYIDEDSKAAAALLMKYMSLPQDGLTLQQAAGIFVARLESFYRDDFSKMAAELEKYTTRDADKGKEYWLYLMQAICYSQAGETEKGKTYAIKARGYKELPAEYRSVLGLLFSLAD